MGMGGALFGLLLLFFKVVLAEECGVCLGINSWLPISIPCGQCAGWRPNSEIPASPTIDTRVTKALGVKGYDQVRVSVIERNGGVPLTPEVQEVFRDQLGAATSPFKYRWTHSTFHTRIMNTTDAETLPAAVRPAPLPKQGAGVTGLLFGDPCTQSGWIKCAHADEFSTRNTTPALVNLFMDRLDLQFYALLGDNFYDQTGEFSAAFWNALTARSKSKVLMTVPGNHDFWVQGAPISRLLWRRRNDQFGYGLAQWHMQDTVAASSSLSDSVFGGPAVFDYSIDPDASAWPVYADLLGSGPIAHASNFFWYNQLGDVVFVGFSGAHSWEEQRSYFQEACTFLGTVQQTTNWVVLLAHWDETILSPAWTGDKLNGPQGYWRMATASCDIFKEYYSHGRLKYATGHTHCNVPNPHKHPQVWGGDKFSLHDNRTGYDGFLLGGMGMADHSPTCGFLRNYGVAVMATTPGQGSEDRLELVYFKVAEVDKLPYQYDVVEACVTTLGWRRCAASRPDVAEVWLNVTAAPWAREGVLDTAARVPNYI